MLCEKADNLEVSTDDKISKMKYAGQPRLRKGNGQSNKPKANSSFLVQGFAVEISVNILLKIAHTP